MINPVKLFSKAVLQTITISFFLLLIFYLSDTSALAEVTVKNEGSKPSRLKITVGESIQLGTGSYINTASLGVSQTGVIAAAVPVYDWPNFEGWQWQTIRVSSDGGFTWTEPMEANRSVMGGGGMWATLRGGGVIKQAGPTYRIPEEEGWLSTFIARFPDDMMSFVMEPARVYMPDADLTLQEPSPLVFAGPVFDKGKIQQLPNGDLLATQYGKFKGDKSSRVFLTRSVDRGLTWRYYATVAYQVEDPNPELPGKFTGYCEPSALLLPNGQMLCMMRTGGWTPYRTMYLCRSEDLGMTWSKPEPTEPHLYSIWPTLQVLDNGVIACVHGRPGFHIAFSTDNGQTWYDKVTFVELPEPKITGQVDMIKIGPNKVLAIGGVGGSGGTRIFPVTVELRDEEK